MEPLGCMQICKTVPVSDPRYSVTGKKLLFWEMLIINVFEYPGTTTTGTRVRYPGTSMHTLSAVEVLEPLGCMHMNVALPI